MEEELKDDLSNYKKDLYEKPSVTVDICICSIIDNKLSVLLIKRGRPPFRDMWAIPGGFLDVDTKKNPDPSLEFAALRELREETGIVNIPVHQLASYGDINRDPRMRVITVAYFATVPSDRIKNEVVKAGDDAKETMWADIKKLPSMAFDHKKILKELLLRIQGRVMYTDLAFSFLPKEFTWSELQEVFEIVLGKKMIAPNFRRKIKSCYNIKELNKYKHSVTGRPSKLLMYKGMKSVF